jgi:Transposase zinc-ribbon domain
MAMNRIQFQQGLYLPAFLAQFGTGEQCGNALEASRWPQGFRCPRCGNAAYYLLMVGKHKTFQCQCYRLQTSLLAGTLFQSTHLALSIWFMAIYLISQAKARLSALDLKRQLGVSYPTAWLIQQKLMQAMVERDAQYALSGDVQVDDAYLGDELAGGKAGRGS